VRWQNAVVRVLATDDPAVVLARAGAFLASDPVRHNVILTLLEDRVAQAVPGRYWVVDPDEPVGVVFQSPLDYAATLTPMPEHAVGAAVDAVAGAGVRLPGVTGDAVTAARFAGAWTERTRSAAVPVQGQRLYEVGEVELPLNAPGRHRGGTDGDRDRLVEWTRAFLAETGERARSAADLVARRLPAGQFWLWDDPGPVSMAALSPAVAGVVRVQNVYTPDDRRGRGYAGALVARISAAALAGGRRCILYTDLGNPSSNAAYRRIGYRAVAEGLRYRFS
jgi:GNAT superfamily N-acetyltransferase